jgi:hypothetical protein
MEMRLHTNSSRQNRTGNVMVCSSAGYVTYTFLSVGYGFTQPLNWVSERRWWFCSPWTIILTRKHNMIIFVIASKGEKLNKQYRIPGRAISHCHHSLPILWSSKDRKCEAFNWRVVHVVRGMESVPARFWVNLKRQGSHTTQYLLHEYLHYKRDLV